MFVVLNIFCVVMIVCMIGVCKFVLVFVVGMV